MTTAGSSDGVEVTLTALLHPTCMQGSQGASLSRHVGYHSSETLTDMSVIVFSQLQALVVTVH
jgi:hypothetical protein